MGKSKIKKKRKEKGLKRIIGKSNVGGGKIRGCWDRRLTNEDLKRDAFSFNPPFFFFPFLNTPFSFLLFTVLLLKQ